MAARLQAARIEETSPQAGTLYLVHVLTHASRGRLDEAMATLGISAFHFTLLSVVGSSGGGMFASQLSRRFHVTPQAMGETIGLLETRGLIARTEDAARKRVLRLSLTEAGAAAVRAGEAVVAGFEGDIFAGAAPSDLAALRRVLGSALAVLRGARVMLEPLTDAAWPPEVERLRLGFAGALNVYRVMAHHPALLAAWENLRNHVVLHSALNPCQREVVILRVGFRWGSEYEWGQHVVRGRAAGLSDAQIIRARDERPGTDDADGLLMACVDALLHAGALDPTLLSQLADLVGEHGVLDVMATVGMYTTLAFIVKTAATPLEPEMARQVGEWEVARG